MCWPCFGYDGQRIVDGREINTGRKDQKTTCLFEEGAWFGVLGEDVLAGLSFLGAKNREILGGALGKRSLVLWLVVGRVALFWWVAVVALLRCSLKPKSLRRPTPIQESLAFFGSSTTTSPNSLPSPTTTRLRHHRRPSAAATGRTPTSLNTTIRRFSIDKTRCKLWSVAAASPPLLSRWFRLCCVGLCSKAAWWPAFDGAPLPCLSCLTLHHNNPFLGHPSPFGSRFNLFRHAIFHRVEPSPAASRSST